MHAMPLCGHRFPNKENLKIHVVLQLRQTKPLQLRHIKNAIKKGGPRLIDPWQRDASLDH